MLLRVNSAGGRTERIRSELIALARANRTRNRIGTPERTLTGEDYANATAGSAIARIVTAGGIVRNLIPCVCTQNSVPSALCAEISLDTIATYLRNYMTEFRNANFWAYTCDGNGFYIGDGGKDMYDDGNFTTPWLLSGDTYITEDTDEEDYPYAIDYETTSQTVIDTDFNYVSLGIVFAPYTNNPQEDTSRHPLTVLGFRCAGPVGWQLGGNLGADGGGDLSSNILYAGASVNGFTVHAGYRQVYNAGDPTVCNLIILLGHPAWASVFGPVSIQSDTDTNSNGFYFYAGAGSENILAIHTVLSKPPDDDSEPIADAELQTVVANFTQRIGEALGL